MDARKKGDPSGAKGRDIADAAFSDDCGYSAEQESEEAFAEMAHTY